MFFFHFYKEDESLRVFGGQFSVALPRCGGSIERRGRREMEQPKVGPRIETFGEGRDRLPQGNSEGGAGRESLRIN